MDTFNVESPGMVKTTSVPANTGVLVAVGVEFGNVATCAPDPTLKNMVFGPSFTTRKLLPLPGNATDELAVDVAEIGNVSDVALNGNVCMSFFLLRHRGVKFVCCSQLDTISKLHPA